MVASFIILFREILEISIILSIIMAATKGVASRGRYVWMGIAGGVLGSGLVAAFAGTISEAVDGMGQEMFNAAILFVAVFMIGWTVVWMKQHGREIAVKIKHVGKAVTDGELPMMALSTVVALTMWREGAEIVLFLTGILSTSEDSTLAITLGALAGGACAAAIGFALYIGILKLSMRHLFSVTSILLILLAAGMSSQAAGFLTASGALPELGQLWDSSQLLSESSVVGKILHAMLGYTERPSGLQLVFYACTVAGIWGLSRRVHKHHHPHPTPTNVGVSS